MMAEYIDREALIAEIQKNIKTYWNEGSGGYYLAEDALNYSVKTVPTADVVSKSEVEELSGKYEDLKLKYADLQKDKDELIACGDDKKADVAREIFEEIEEYAELQIESLNIAAKVDLSGAVFFGGGKQAFVLLLDRLAELKKKYMEQKNG